MKKVTKQSLIDDIAAAWVKQYPNDEKKEIADALIIKKPKTEHEVAEIIGNTSWTENICEECQKDCDTTIQFCGDPFDDHEVICVLCENCIDNALKLIRTSKNSNQN